MRILNADGSEAGMCGNGIRCLMRFIQETIADQPFCTIESLQRIHKITSNGDLIGVEMGNPTEVDWDLKITLPEDNARIHFLNTGVPHCVEFVRCIEGIDIGRRGFCIRNHNRFAPTGVNYNAAEILEDGTISVRTFERGVEAETLACGTGATATALAAARIYGCSSPVTILTRSGETLTIHFQLSKDSFEEVWMVGSAHKIYRGRAKFKVFQLKDTHFLE